MAPKSKEASSSSAAVPRKTPRRIRRKCSHPSCPNRVVQGGVCVTHGAKRKMCLHPGCDKAVKLAGYCSTHGPARRKCDAAGCTRVAVQGGKCLSHGAKRRVCKFPGGSCNKNAIVGGMCKKHYDLMKDANGLLDSLGTCVAIEGSGSGESEGTEVSDSPVYGHVNHAALGYQTQDQLQAKPPAVVVLPPVPPAQEPHPPLNDDTSLVNLHGNTAAPVINVAHQAHEAAYVPVEYPKPPPKKKHKHPRHQRGLSIFEEMQTVNAIINSGAENQQGVILPEAVPPPPPAPQANVSYGYPSPDHPNDPNEASIMPPPPPHSLPQVPVVPTLDTSANTPAPQVSYADGAIPTQPSNPENVPTKHSEEPYYSPTIAIFEQMIKASEVIENPAKNPSYAGLSPPKLTPRGRRHVSFQDDLMARTIHHQAPAATMAVAPVHSADYLYRTVSHDEESHNHHPYPIQAYPAHAYSNPAMVQGPRVSSPTNDMLHQSSCAPETPNLDSHPEPMNIVSAGSQHGSHQQTEAAYTVVGLLPKRKDEYEHLFIPRALS
ncbi:hypothetical protein HJC23_011722 [Cyclotella cryptica]|uniref:WRKY transcription factor 19 n=1 Tax=Cyclotella cryptica TaxID=29204 RepID=A0ABD3QJF3_9STRA|eukprot:CCRYP_004853-RA/>CCRYP_004853-RA protein AED:0.33 eAED:0.33 QI:0/-1/0/1/-1/1/1/0/545